MKAFVINEDQIIKAGMALTGVVIAFFLLGYYVGSKNLITDNGAQQENKAAVESTKPAEGVAAKTDKSPKLEAQAVKPEKKNKALVKKKTETKQPKKVLKKADVKKKEVKRKVAKAETKKRVEKAKVKPAVTQKKPAKKERVKTNETKTAAVMAASSANASSIKEAAVITGERFYSIQAGMFASEANANSFIEKLSQKQFNAYVSDFVSTSGATKYNVRVGKFEQRDQARLLLKEFQKSFSSPAYVVITQ